MTTRVLKVELEPETGRSLLAAKELLGLFGHSDEAVGARREESLAGLYRATGSAALRSRASHLDSSEPGRSHADEAPHAAARRRPRTDGARGSGNSTPATRLPLAIEGHRARQPHTAVELPGAAAGESGSPPPDGETADDVQAMSVPSGQVDVPAWPGGCLTPTGEASRGQAGPVGQPADLLSPGTYQEAGPSGRSITVIYGDKIDANNYYGRSVDNANTTEVRGGTTDDME